MPKKPHNMNSLWERDAHLQALLRTRYQHDPSTIFYELWANAMSRDELPSWQPLLNATIEMVRLDPQPQRYDHWVYLLSPRSEVKNTNTHVWELP